jgi:DNA-binding winged helix-turn-helix (wHTH) protein
MRVGVLQRDPDQSKLLEKAILETGHTCAVFDDGMAMTDRPFGRSCSRSRLACAASVRLRRAPIRAGDEGQSPACYLRLRGQLRREHGARFASGADDYVTLPLRVVVFRERLAAMIRRTYQTDIDVLRAGPYQFDPNQRTVTIDGKRIVLSVTRYRLARLFFSNVGRVLTREHIFSAIWCREFNLATRTIDSHVSRLRSMPGIYEENGFTLQPVYKSGYRLTRYASAADADAPRILAA